MAQRPKKLAVVLKRQKALLTPAARAKRHTNYYYERETKPLTYMYIHPTVSSRSVRVKVQGRRHLHDGWLQEYMGSTMMGCSRCSSFFNLSILRYVCMPTQKTPRVFRLEKKSKNYLLCVFYGLSVKAPFLSSLSPAPPFDANNDADNALVDNEQPKEAAVDCR